MLHQSDHYVASCRVQITRYNHLQEMCYIRLDMQSGVIHGTSVMEANYVLF